MQEEISWLEGDAERRERLLDSAWPDILDRIADIQEHVRVEAAHALISGLNRKSEDDMHVFLTLPLGILDRGDVIAAIWYIETVGKLGNTVHIDTLEEVFRSAIDQRNEYKKYETQEWIDSIDIGLQALFSMGMQHRELMRDPRLFLMIWQFEEIRWNTEEAIQYYDVAAGLNHADGYIGAAWAYDTLWKPDKAISILESGYSRFWDLRFLRNSISILCKAWKIQEAQKKYEDLQKKVERPIELFMLNKNPLVPFVVFKWFIEDDNDLISTQDAIAEFVSKWEFEPSEWLRVLGERATEYIWVEVNKENLILEKLEKKDKLLWWDEDHSEFYRATTRRLKLVQIDLLSLCNHRYIEFYLMEIETLWIKWSNYTQHLLREFFEENFSAEAKIRVMEWEKLKSMKEGGDWAIKETISIPGNLFENISNHIATVIELYWQPWYHDMHANTSAMILKKAKIQEWKYDEEVESSITNTLWYLRDQSNFYFSLKPEIQERYESYMELFDKNYGAIHRRQIQSIATNTDNVYPESLKKNVDMAFLFWMTKIIAKRFPTEDPREIQELFENYWLNEVTLGGAILLAGLIYEVSIPHALNYLVKYPWMLEFEYAIYIITEWLKYTDKSILPQVLSNLDTIIETHYEGNGFFEHVDNLLDDEEEGESSGQAESIAYLIRGNIAYLQWDDIDMMRLNYKLAWTTHNPIEWLIQSGDTHANTGDYDAAMHFYESALLHDENVIILSRILWCAIKSRDFDKAEKYMHLAISRWYEIENYILAFHLWQGNSEQAFLQMIHMIRGNTQLLDAIEWLQRLLVDTLEFELNRQGMWDFSIYKLKILASYIRIMLKLDWKDENPEYCMRHLEYCIELINAYWWASQCEMICSVLGIFTWEIDSIDRLTRHIPNDAVEYIDAHAQWIVLKLEQIAAKEVDEEKKWAILKQVNSAKIAIIAVLQRFPESENYTTQWQDELDRSH